VNDEKVKLKSENYDFLFADVFLTMEILHTHHLAIIHWCTT